MMCNTVVIARLVVGVTAAVRAILHLRNGTATGRGHHKLKSKGFDIISHDRNVLYKTSFS